MYLAITNPGVADYRGFTLLGVSTTRNAGYASTIGQFGSGSKLSIALLLRNGIEPVICCGNLKLNFFIKEENIKGQVFNRVCVRYQGKDLDGTNKSATEDLGFTLEWGVQDWNSLDMAMRELVSNAIDGSICAGGSHKAVKFEVVENPRAKAGCTVIYLPWTEQVQQMNANVNTMFLHFKNPELLEATCLPKRNASHGRVYIYKKGVLVSSIKGESVFDYNLGNSLTLDESRNASEWHVKHAICQALQNESPENLAKIMRGVSNDEKIWESGLDSSYLSINSYDREEVKDEKKSRFKQAWDIAAGENAVASSGCEVLNRLIHDKGYKPVIVPSNWFNALQSYGVVSELSILSKSEAEGKIECEPTLEMIAAVDSVWKFLEEFNLTNGKDKPLVKGFTSIMDGGAMKLGYFIPFGHTVYLHTTLGGRILFCTTLEEVVHYTTGSLDGSRDIQDFLFNLITEMVFTEQHAA